MNLQLLIGCQVFAIGAAYSQGAPCAAQDSLTPSDIYHGTPQDKAKNPPPFKFRVLAEDGSVPEMFEAGATYMLRLSGKTYFRGFALQARPADDSESTEKLGEFTEDLSWERIGIRYQDCSGTDHNALTHSNNARKYYFSVRWVAPADFAGPIQFVLTIVHNQSTFWTQWTPEAARLESEASTKERSTTQAVKLITAAETTTTTTTPAKTTKIAIPQKEESPQVIEVQTRVVEKLVTVKPVEVKQPLEIDHCKINPCFNGGSCVNTAEGFFCECTADFTGETCLERNFCKDTPCKNGGFCKNTEFGYECECPVGWSGQICQQTCPAYLCKNGGTCVFENRSYNCKCTEGWEGNECEREINECVSLQPCLNGATCIDRFNGYECRCAEGFTGNECQRPCTDIYLSCQRWKEEDRCDFMRPLTKFFDVNCAVTCDQCKPNNKTVISWPPLPPALEPYDWIIGRWFLNSTSNQHFPLDYSHGDTYSEWIDVSIAPVPMFGAPSLNYSVFSHSNTWPLDVHQQYGFLTLEPRTKNRTADNKVTFKGVLHSSTNAGLAIVEEGTVTAGVPEFTLETMWSASLPALNYRFPKKVKRTFKKNGTFLHVTVDFETQHGTKEKFSSYYRKEQTFKYYH